MIRKLGLKPETKVQDKSRRDDRIQPGVLTPGITSPHEKKSRKGRRKKAPGERYKTTGQLQKTARQGHILH